MNIYSDLSSCGYDNSYSASRVLTDFWNLNVSVTGTDQFVAQKRSKNSASVSSILQQFCTQKLIVSHRDSHYFCVLSAISSQKVKERT